VRCCWLLVVVVWLFVAVSLHSAQLHCTCECLRQRISTAAAAVAAVACGLTAVAVLMCWGHRKHTGEVTAIVIVTVVADTMVAVAFGNGVSFGGEMYSAASTNIVSFYSHHSTHRSSVSCSIPKDRAA
jgi:hypothetical protein